MSTIADIPKFVSGLAPHPLANQFDMIEKTDGPAFEALKASIAKQGILQPIVLFEGRILDGRNRFKAAREVGHRFTPGNFKCFDGTPNQAEAFVNDANIHRRHLSKDQREALIKRELAAHPEMTARQIAKRCGVSHTLVNNVRLAKPKDDDPAYSSFRRAWEKLDDRQRHKFMAEFSSDLAEMRKELSTA